MMADEDESQPSGLTREVEEELFRMVGTRKRIDFLDALHLHADKLRNIPLPEAKVDKKQALKDNDREEVLLNGVQFIGREELPHFRSAMKAVALSAGMSDRQAGMIVERVLRSTSRTASGADSYFMVDRLFVRGAAMSPAADDSPLPCESEPYLLLKPLSTAMMPQPVRIDMRAVSDSHVRCQISTTNNYGLFLLEDIERFTQHSLGEPEPWIRLDTEVREEFTFGGGADFGGAELGAGGDGASSYGVETREDGLSERRAVRTLSIETPEPAPAISDELIENF